MFQNTLRGKIHVRKAKSMVPDHLLVSYGFYIPRKMNNRSDFSESIFVPVSQEVMKREETIANALVNPFIDARKTDELMIAIK